MVTRDSARIPVHSFRKFPAVKAEVGVSNEVTPVWAGLVLCTDTLEGIQKLLKSGSF